MKWTIAEDATDWQRQVLERCDGRCSWPGCNSTWNLWGHHIIDRRYEALKLIVENGIGLCGKHHTRIQTALKKDRERMSILLIGSRMYSVLKELQMENLGDIGLSGKNQLPSSKDINTLL